MTQSKWYTITLTGPIALGNLTPVGQNSGYFKKIMKNLNLEWLICREPVHIGGADSSSRGNNNPIYRLPDRTPVIPGSSLRGALREAAEHHDNENITAFGGILLKNLPSLE